MTKLDYANGPRSAAAPAPNWTQAAYLDVQQQLLLRQLEEQQMAAEKLKKQLLAQFTASAAAGGLLGDAFLALYARN